MLNIRAFISALKATWIRRLIIKNGEWQNIVNKLINLRDIVNLGDVHARQVSEKISNKFWADVIKAFSDISKCNTPTFSYSVSNTTSVPQ